MRRIFLVEVKISLGVLTATRADDFHALKRRLRAVPTRVTVPAIESMLTTRITCALGVIGCN